MTELETMLVTIVTKYGLPALLLGAITIFLIGVLKYFDVFRKIPKDNRKPIYLVLNYIIVFALTAAYYGIFKLRFTDYVSYAFVVATVVNLLYPIYENLKIREFFGAIGRFIVKKVAKKQVEEEKETATNITVEDKMQTKEDNKVPAGEMFVDKVEEISTGSNLKIIE